MTRSRRHSRARALAVVRAARGAPIDDNEDADPDPDPDPDEERVPADPDDLNQMRRDEGSDDEATDTDTDTDADDGVSACAGAGWRFLHALRDLVCCYWTCSSYRAAKYHADRCRMLVSPLQRRLPAARQRRRASSRALHSLVSGSPPQLPPSSQSSSQSSSPFPSPAPSPSESPSESPLASPHHQQQLVSPPTSPRRSSISGYGPVTVQEAALVLSGVAKSAGTSMNAAHDAERGVSPPRDPHMAWAPRSADPFCARCRLPTSGICPHCQITRYCSQKCRLADIAYHRNRCYAALVRRYASMLRPHSSKQLLADFALALPPSGRAIENTTPSK